MAFKGVTFQGLALRHPEAPGAPYAGGMAGGLLLPCFLALSLQVDPGTTPNAYNTTYLNAGVTQGESVMSTWRSGTFPNPELRRRACEQDVSRQHAQRG